MSQLREAMSLLVVAAETTAAVAADQDLVESRSMAAALLSAAEAAIAAGSANEACKGLFDASDATRERLRLLWGVATKD